MKHRIRHKKTAAVFLTVVLILSGLTGCGKQGRSVRETEDITFGIDVARYQGTIDWEKVASSGVDFAMVRLGYRGMEDREITEDSNARYNLQEGSKAGIPMGAYFFSTAVSVEEAIEEAQWAAQLMAGYPVTYPVVYDCEGFDDPGSRQYGMPRGERTDAALAFLNTIEDLGYEGMFYASKNELETSWDMDRIQDAYKIWVAQYPAEPYPVTEKSSYTGIHHMWQYTTEGRIDGISQSVDLNVAYFGYDGIEKPKDKHTPAQVQPDPEALMDFTAVDEVVTAKEETRLRDRPSQGEDSVILDTLLNGETAQRIAVSSNGWSKLLFEGNTCYAVSSYLTTDLNYDPASVQAEEDPDGIQTEFSPVNEQVTAKEEVNLRSLPSVENKAAQVLYKLKHGDVALRVGISENGWSKLEYNGITCYAVSSYLEPANGETAATQADPDGVQTEFESVNERMTPKDEVNLRTLPSTEHPDVKVVVKIKKGDVVLRTGINRDLGWSRVEYNGQILYCVSSYLTQAE